MASRRRLTALTKAQAAELPRVRDEWIRIGLSTARADRTSAEAGVREAYRAAGIEAPLVVIWLESPLAGALGAALLAQGLKRAQVGAQVWAQVGAQVVDQVWAQVGDQVEDQVRAQVGDQVGAQVWDQVWAQVGDQVWDQVWAQVRAQVRAQVGHACYGQHDAGWLAFYAAFRPHIPDTIAPLSSLLTVAQAAGWWWPFTGAVILTERPTHLSRDATGRLHDATGMAIRYADGFGVHAWHGLRVPADVIEHPETLTPDRIQSEANAELRRAMIERIGWDVWLTQSGARPVQSDRYGDLYRTELNGARIGVVVVTNSTPEPDGRLKRYAILVPPEHETAHGAVASTFGLTADQYAPACET